MDIVEGKCNDDNSKLHDFIQTYKTLPEVWDRNCKNYKRKDKKNIAYKKLLAVYKKVKPDATLADVKKKINILRSNFRKELKRVMLSQQFANGPEDVYKPRSKLFHELTFLQSLENEEILVNTKIDDYEDDTFEEKEIPVVSTPIRLNVRKPETQIEYLASPCNTVINEDEDMLLVKFWLYKLKSLSPEQKLYAEKAINDVLFEAQLGTLHSVQINNSEKNVLAPFSQHKPE